MRHEMLTDETDRDLHVTVSGDGKSAWAFVASTLHAETGYSKATYTWRASDVLVKTDAGWRIAAAVWSQPIADDEA